MPQCFEMYFLREQFWCAPVFWNVLFEGAILMCAYVLKFIFWGSDFEEHLCFEMHFLRQQLFWSLWLLLYAFIVAD